MRYEQTILYVGIDIGSTTTKIVAVDAKDGTVLYSDYRRHHADQAASVSKAVWKLSGRFPGARLQPVLTGSGAKQLADALGLPFTQEVVANALALRTLYVRVGTAIELGGQDAKMIFFRRNQATGQLETADMRMNGSCAGGTGAFLDEVASILDVPVEELDALAAQGRCVYDISGRCGVYAKTDIQPLLNQGVSRADLALSAFHAVAKQTIGGLAQGLTIQPPVAFEGGPLTFNHTLVQVFSERLGLGTEDILLPEHPERMMAYGAALSARDLWKDQGAPLTAGDLLTRLQNRPTDHSEDGPLYFASAEEESAFKTRHALPAWSPLQPAAGQTVRGYLGIDSGSTTTKFVLLGEDGRLLDSFYAPNRGEPLLVARDALIALRDRYRKAGAQLDILGVGTTGYGEQLFANAFSAEYHVVETVAHARAAAEYVPNASFLLDIGGQDIFRMKSPDFCGKLQAERR